MSLKKLSYKFKKEGAIDTGAVRQELEVLANKVRSVEAYRSVTGAIPVDLLDAVEHALRILTPMTAFLGDFELTNLLSSLKIWVSKKRMEQEQEQAHARSFTNLDFGEFGQSNPGFNQYW